MGTKSIFVKSFLEKNATFKLLPVITSQLNIYLKSISAGQKLEFYVKETFIIFQCYKFNIHYSNFIK